MARKTPPRLHLFNATLRGIDEVENFKSAEDRQRAFAEVANEVRGRELALGIALTTVAAFVSYLAARALFQYVLPRSVPAWLAEAGCFAAVFGGALLTVRALHRWGAAQELRRKLVAAGVPVCLECGYRLDGLGGQSETCPECGERISPHVRLLLEARTPSGRETGPT